MAGIRLDEYPAKVIFQKPQIILGLGDVLMPQVPGEQRKRGIQVEAFFMHLFQRPHAEGMAEM